MFIKTILVLSAAIATNAGTIDWFNATVTNSTELHKRQNAHGFIMPVYGGNHALYLKFRHNQPAATYTPGSVDPDYIKMLLTARCRKSSFNDYDNQYEQVPFQFVVMTGTSIMGQEIDLHATLSRIARQGQPLQTYGAFCIKSTVMMNDPFNRMILGFDNQVVSSWFMSSSQIHGAERPIGQIGFGTLNEHKMVAGETARFPLKPLRNIQNMPSEWITLNPVPLHQVGQAEPLAECEMTFDYSHTLNFLPTNVYEQIIRPLRGSIRLATASAGLPPDIVRYITNFVNEPIFYFDCADAARLPNLRFGPLPFSRELLFVEYQGRCILTIHPIQRSTCRFALGFSTIKQFHFSVNFQGPEGEYAQFAGAVPYEPAQDTASSSSAASSSSDARSPRRESGSSSSSGRRIVPDDGSN